MHSAAAQANGSRAAGTHVRRREIDTVHPVVRVHPVTGEYISFVCNSTSDLTRTLRAGWKSVFVNPGAYYLSLILDLRLSPRCNSSHTGFTRKIVGIPKAESDAILAFLFAQLSNNPDFQVRIRWNKNQIVFWDNRVCILCSNDIRTIPKLLPHFGVRHSRSPRTPQYSISSLKDGTHCVPLHTRSGPFLLLNTNELTANRRKIGKRRSGKRWGMMLMLSRQLT